MYTSPHPLYLKQMVSSLAIERCSPTYDRSSRRFACLQSLGPSARRSSSPVRRRLVLRFMRTPVYRRDESVLRIYGKTLRSGKVKGQEQGIPFGDNWHVAYINLIPNSDSQLGLALRLSLSCLLQKASLRNVCQRSPTRTVFVQLPFIPH